MAKIISFDNFGRESKADQLVCSNVNAFYGPLILKLLQEHPSCSDVYLRLVEDDYELWKGMEELV